ncbi:MAG: hypothetical protein LBD17_02055 [Endomicrobium sp.]|jgi:hypothetical protein|nr:hypothetical protein [Endomicrobium sp.]
MPNTVLNNSRRQSEIETISSTEPQKTANQISLDSARLPKPPETPLDEIISSCKQRAKYLNMLSKGEADTWTDKYSERTKSIFSNTIHVIGDLFSAFKLSKTEDADFKVSMSRMNLYKEQIKELSVFIKDLENIREFANSRNNPTKSPNQRLELSEHKYKNEKFSNFIEEAKKLISTNNTTQLNNLLAYSSDIQSRFPLDLGLTQINNPNIISLESSRDVYFENAAKNLGYSETGLEIAETVTDLVGIAASGGTTTVIKGSFKLLAKNGAEQLAKKGVKEAAKRSATKELFTKSGKFVVGGAGVTAVDASIIAGRGAVDYANGGDFNEIVENSSEKIKHKAIDNAAATAGMIIGEPVIMGASKIPFVKHVVGGTFRKFAVDTAVGDMALQTVKGTLEGHLEDISKNTISTIKYVGQGEAWQDIKSLAENIKQYYVGKDFKLDMPDGAYSLIRERGGSIVYIEVKDKDSVTPDSILLKSSKSFLEGDTLYVIANNQKTVLVIPKNEYLSIKNIADVQLSNEKIPIDEEVRDSLIRKSKNYHEVQQDSEVEDLKRQAALSLFIEKSSELFEDFATSVYVANNNLEDADTLKAFVMQDKNYDKDLKPIISALRLPNENEGDFYARLFEEYVKIKALIDDLENKFKNL